MAGTAPNYDNQRWGGAQGGRVPQEAFPATFAVYKEIDLGSQAGTITLSANQAMASLITVTPTAAVTLVWPASNPGQSLIIRNLAADTYSVTCEVSGNVSNTAVVAANTQSEIVHTGDNGGIAIVSPVTAALSNTVISGTLSVSGATTLSAAVTVGTTLGVTGAATLSSTLHVVGAVTADAAVTSTGAFTASSTSHLVGAITADGAATVTGILSTGPIRRRLTAITADGAIDQHTAANYVFTKAGVAAMTLAAPTATTDDGLIIQLSGTTADQNTITATGLFKDGAGHVNVATWPAAIGGTLTLMAYQAKWYVIANNNVVMS